MTQKPVKSWVPLIDRLERDAKRLRENFQASLHFIKEIKEALVSQFNAKDNQFRSFERGVEGQFELFRDKLEE